MQQKISFRMFAVLGSVLSVLFLFLVIQYKGTPTGYDIIFEGQETVDESPSSESNSENLPVPVNLLAEDLAALQVTGKNACQALFERVMSDDPFFVFLRNVYLRRPPAVLVETIRDSEGNDQEGFREDIYAEPPNEVTERLRTMYENDVYEFSDEVLSYTIQRAINERSELNRYSQEELIGRIAQHREPTKMVHPRYSDEYVLLKDQITQRYGSIYYYPELIEHLKSLSEEKLNKYNQLAWECDRTFDQQDITIEKAKPCEPWNEEEYIATYSKTQADCAEKLGAVVRAVQQFREQKIPNWPAHAGTVEGTPKALRDIVVLMEKLSQTANVWPLPYNVDEPVYVREHDVSGKIDRKIQFYIRQIPFQIKPYFIKPEDQLQEGGPVTLQNTPHRRKYLPKDFRMLLLEAVRQYLEDLPTEISTLWQGNLLLYSRVDWVLEAEEDLRLFTELNQDDSTGYTPAVTRFTECIKNVLVTYQESACAPTCPKKQFA